MSENRHGLIVEMQVTEANGTAKCSAAIAMIEQISGAVRCTVAADKAYYTHDFVERMRELHATPRVAQSLTRSGSSAIDEHTTHHAGYLLSLQARKLIEEALGWGKGVGLLRRPEFRGRRKLELSTLLTFTGYNLVRMRNLLAPDFR